jgi:hypothetical protein
LDATHEKSIVAKFLVTFPLFMKTAGLKAYGLIAIVFLTGCTATVVRWNAVKMREEIMAYYNDEIMDNLIRMKEGLPFVHIDISSVSAAGISQVSGTVGGGETESFTKTSPSMIKALHTISRAATAPFAYSVTPLHSDTLTMTAVPVIGQLPADNTDTKPNDKKLEPSKRTVTEITVPPKTPDDKPTLVKTITTTENTPAATPKAKTTTIYDVYDRFRCSLVKNALLYSELEPNKKEVVPGTLKRHGAGYYYILNDSKGENQKQYTELCNSLFTQSRGPTTKTAKADLEVLKAQGPTVPSTFRP